MSDDFQLEPIAPEESRADVARRIFAYWQETTKHPRARLDERRMKKICERLKDGYTEEDLRLAVLGLATSKFHQGRNDRFTVYDSIELVVRNADQVDKFMRLGEEEVRRRDAIAEDDERLRRERIAASTTGEGYQGARKALLSIVKKDAA